MTRFRMEAEMRARAQASEIAQAAELALAGDHRRMIATFSYDAAAIAAAGRPGRAVRGRQLATAIRATLGSSDLSVNNFHVPPDQLPEGLRDAAFAISVDPSGRGHVRMMPVTHGGVMADRIDKFLMGRLESKREQHVGWGRGLLAIDHGPLESADDFAAGFARLKEPHPWWRVYWTDTGRRAHLVATTPDSG